MYVHRSRKMGIYIAGLMHMTKFYSRSIKLLKKTSVHLDLRMMDLPYRDKLEVKAANDGSASYAALEKKAALYEKLVRGELSDEEDKEKYCVDFFQKNLMYESETPQHRHTLLTEPPETEDDDNDAAVLFNTKPVGSGRTSGIIDNNEHKRFVREVHEEVNQAREKASELKLRHQEQVATRREKLKQAYLRKQVEKLKAVSKTEQT